MKKEEWNTRELLIKAGKEEFLEKGFEKASLRKICEKSGVTTGAVYFFFENKEDLFHQIVADTIKQMENIGKELSRAELDEHISSSDGDRMLMEFLWNHREEVQLLWEKSEGTRYENFKDEIFSQLEHSFTMFFQKYGMMEEDKNLIRIIVKMRMKGYMELIYGDYSMEEMLRLSELIGCYADGGFYSLQKELEEKHKQNKEEM